MVLSTFDSVTFIHFEFLSPGNIVGFQFLGFPSGAIVITAINAFSDL